MTIARWTYCESNDETMWLEPHDAPRPPCDAELVLASDYDAALTRIRELEEEFCKLRTYAGHIHDCPKKYVEPQSSSGISCTCGLDDLVAAPETEAKCPQIVFGEGTEANQESAARRVMTDAEVYAMVDAGNVIGAIKEYRHKSGSGLREAKNHVEGLIKRRRYQSAKNLEQK